MRATSSITPIPIDAIEFATRSDAEKSSNFLLIGFLVLSVMVVIAGLFGAL